MKLFFVLTQNCNLSCEHCFISACPGKVSTTIDIKNFKKIVDHLPKDKKEFIDDKDQQIIIKLTGGEVFTIKKELYALLDILKKEKLTRAKKEHVPLLVSVLTNGFFASSNSAINEVLHDLKERDVDHLEICSNDNYHFKQGINIEKINQLKLLAEKSGFFKEVKIKGVKEKEVFPIGRAANIIGTHISSDKPDCINFLEKNVYSLFPSGNIYIGCCRIFKLPGNLIKESFSDIIAKVKVSRYFEDINKKGPLELIQNIGGLQKSTEMINKKGNCWTCINLLGKENQNFQEI